MPNTLAAVIAEMAQAANTASKTYTLPSGSETYTSAVTLTMANSPASVVIDGGNRVVTGSANRFTIGSGVTLTLKNITFTKIPFIVSAGGTLVLDNGSIVRKNVTRAGVTVIGGTLEMRDGSSVTENGDSGIWMKGAGGKFTMNGGEISGNDAADYGGGVSLWQDGNINFNMTGGTIKNNTATSDGGGVFAIGASFLNMTGGEITGNIAGGNGDGVYIVFIERLTGNPSIGSKVNGKGSIYGNDGDGDLYAVH